MTEEVDVIIPFSSLYTSKEMLNRAKKSVQKQTMETNIIVRADEGVSSARNKGLEKSKNRFVAFSDADDFWKPTKIEKQFNKMRETGKGVCLCKSLELCRKGSSRKSIIRDPETESTEKFIQNVFLRKTIGFTSSIIIDTKKIKSKFNESFSRREDHLFIISAVKEGGICFVPEILTFLDRHTSGLSSSCSPEEVIQMDRKFYREATKIWPFLEDHKSEYWSKNYSYYAYLFYSIEKFSNSAKYSKKSLKYKPTITSKIILILSLLGNFGLNFKKPLEYLKRFLS